ncbi:MAG: hypothetical protein HYU66_21625, partial [Armatimonadetes bacterium]|nr:hypothetical protein [Armatimonadota bacterium]
GAGAAVTARLTADGEVELAGDVAAVDWWAVDYAPEPGRPFRFDWHAGRERKGGGLALTAPPAAMGAAGVAVRVVDIRGGTGWMHVSATPSLPRRGQGEVQSHSAALPNAPAPHPSPLLGQERESESGG